MRFMGWLQKLPWTPYDSKKQRKCSNICITRTSCIFRKQSTSVTVGVKRVCIMNIPVRSYRHWLWRSQGQTHSKYCVISQISVGLENSREPEKQEAIWMGKMPGSTVLTWESVSIATQMLWVPKLGMATMWTSWIWGTLSQRPQGGLRWCCLLTEIETNLV